MAPKTGPAKPKSSTPKKRVSVRGRLHAPEGFATPAGRKLILNTTDETFRLLSICVVPTCKICKLAATNPDLLFYINKSSAIGILQREIVAECARLGFTVSEENLSTHKRKHYAPMYRDHLNKSAGAATLADIIRDYAQDVSVGASIIRTIVLKLNPILDGLDPNCASAKRLSFEKKVNLLRGLAKDLAQIQNNDASTELRRLDQQLRQLRLLVGEKKLRAKILSELGDRLQAQYPEVWRIVELVGQQAYVVPALPPAAGPEDAA
jgi:hypothetical protein